MQPLATIHELKSTLADTRAHGDLPGHLRALWQTLHIPDPDAAQPQSAETSSARPITPGDSVTVHGIPGHVLYPLDIPGYWAIAVPGQLNRSAHERNIQVVA
jgi:hypothetical protein